MYAYRLVENPFRGRQQRVQFGASSHNPRLLSKFQLGANRQGALLSGTLMASGSAAAAAAAADENGLSTAVAT